MRRRTPQGETVRKVLRLAERPLTPSEIHSRATKRLAGISRATCYRHIKNLSKGGLILGVDYPGQPTRYEQADGEQKIHFGCRSCEKLFAVKEGLDFKEPKPPNLPSGFQVDGGEWILYGTCPACSSKASGQ